MTVTNPIADGARRRAVRFFWSTLIAAAGASVAGNIAHAVLAEPGHALIAAAAAVVPPAVLLGSTHGVALLVRTRTVGATYWCALAMTVMLAACAFVLSFDALRALALTWAGFSPATAWLWPLAIDLSIAQSTLALLALSGTPRRGGGARNGAALLHNGFPLHSLDAPPEDTQSARTPDAAYDWSAKADELIRAGVTRINRDKAATVLAELASGTAPSTIEVVPGLVEIEVAVPRS
ncbi:MULTISPECIES: DUF2637 domain-containing protein [Mycobacterium]|uniref:DUF2637 domain-containing protein n=1 Tax=Mycobacterium TaxID=1763 RepID=UPI00079FE8D2|nr:MULTISPECIES: DUF2637 domain-containing protein [Mycobacterium]MCV7100893.1 DUF2637 domain-containing protein [Mycobacterium palustre]MDV3218038.1 DUF2637 domain-containing protein [Mycobacterium avium]